MVWVISIIVSFAAPVSEQAAMLAAQKFIHQQLPAMTRGERIELTRAVIDVADGEAPGIYVFNATNGYVVVSADDKFPEILAYGNGEPFDAAKAPADMKAMLEAYYHAATSQAFTRANVQTHDDIAPFITTKWNQLEPYNLLCPSAGKGGEPCPTGCVATAMAQVMYYYQYPANYEWDKMKTAYSKTDSGEAVDAVAQLMVDCGTACFMDYSVDGSGTSDIYACEALRYDFGYSETTEYVERECYTAESWDALIYNEISAKRPVMYGALSASSGQGVSGHEFILDGYEVKNGIGYYHVNWGWGGNSDDYFLLSVLNPDYHNENLCRGEKAKVRPGIADRSYKPDRDCARQVFRRVLPLRNLLLHFPCVRGCNLILRVTRMVGNSLHLHRNSAFGRLADCDKRVYLGYDREYGSCRGNRHGRRPCYQYDKLPYQPHSG